MNVHFFSRVSPICHTPNHHHSDEAAAARVSTYQLCGATKENRWFGKGEAPICESAQMNIRAHDC